MFAIFELRYELILLYEHLLNHFFQILLVLAHIIDKLYLLVIFFSLFQQLLFKLQFDSLLSLEIYFLKLFLFQLGFFALYFKQTLS